MKRPEAAYNVNATKTNAPIRTIVPATMTTTKNLAIPANAGMTRFVAGTARFVRYVGGCRPGDDSHRLIWEAVFSWLAFRSSSLFSFPWGSLAAAWFAASDCSCHFCSTVFFLTMMQSPYIRREHNTLSHR